MPITPGTRLGPYEILSALGAGGMGEVYRAKDSKLGRDVAIKVLPDAVAADPERLARFHREAQVLASLNHPNIAHIYGFEDDQLRRPVLDTREGHGPSASGVGMGPHASYLVMELVDGPTLADLLSGSGLQALDSGPVTTVSLPKAQSLEPKAKSVALPLAESLAIARQIAEALEAAHEQGIIHRDLKPANVKVREDGTVKVLDFGLAKMLEPASAGQAGLSASPTITTPAATMAGVILGTAAYMSPEQAKGLTADKRSDVWAFGCVLFEMLSGTRAFPGDDVGETLASVLAREPDWTALPNAVPEPVCHLLRRCLQKDRRQRLRQISTTLEWLDAVPALVHHTGPDREATREHVAAAMTTARRAFNRRLALAGALGVVLAVAVGIVVWVARTPTAPRVVRTMLAATGDSALAISGAERDLTITPDGSRVVYVGNRGSQLFVRALDGLEPVAIASGTALRSPFVSPDGQWVGFLENLTTLKKVAIAGGPVLSLATLDTAMRGATWLPDNTIVVATANPNTGLQRLSANGGAVEVLTRPDHSRGETDHLWPAAVPGGRVVLFTITATGGLDAAQVAAVDLQTHATTVLMRGSDARYFDSGHLLYVAGGTLQAVPFDWKRLAVRGAAVPLASRVGVTPSGGADVAAAADGTLVYVDAPAGLTGRSLVWVDRTGREQALAAPPRAYVYPRLSPDGTRIVVSAADQEQDLWVWDLRRAILTRLTLEPSLDSEPVWTPDGTHIIFDSTRGGGRNLWWQAADGTGTAERLTTSEHAQVPHGLTPDGRTMIFGELTGATGIDIMQLPLAGDRRPAVLVQTKFNEQNATVSPDGHWLAYESDASGRNEIYVRPYPTVAASQWQISAAGGTRPLWSRTGAELFFVAPDNAIMGVPVEAKGTTWNAGSPAKLLSDRSYFNAGGPSRTYDVAADGRFLLIKTADAAGSATPPQIVVVAHADQELKRLAPTSQ